MILRGQQLDEAYKRISILFAGWQPKNANLQNQTSNQKSNTSIEPQQFITKQIIYKTFQFAKNLRLLRERYKQLQNNQQMINRADRYIKQIKAHHNVDQNVRNIAVISLQNAKQQLKTPPYYIKKMKEQQGRILSWVQSFYDLPNNLEMRHLQRAKPIKRCLAETVFTDEILRGYYEDYIQTKEIIEEIYNQFLDDKEMIEMFGVEAQNLFQQIMKKLQKM